MADHSKFMKLALEKIKKTARSASASRLKRKLEGKSKPAPEAAKEEPADEMDEAELDEEEATEGLDDEEDEPKEKTELLINRRGVKTMPKDIETIPVKRGRGRPKKVS